MDSSATESRSSEDSSPIMHATAKADDAASSKARSCDRVNVSESPENEGPICYKRRAPTSGEQSPDCGLGFHFDHIRNVRTQHLRRLLASLSTEQREDVKAIGFGGLLDFSCESLANEMNEWLIECFNPVSQNFEVGKIRFCLTGLDGRRVFGLSYSPSHPVLFNRHDDSVVSLLAVWKSQYCTPGKDAIDFYQAYALIRKMRGGGDDFKRLFVLYVMKGFLTPEFGSHLEFGLLRSLLDVQEIRSFDWASYVVQHLCDSLLIYRRRPSPRGCEGCLLLLQVVYLHSCIWKGEILPTEEPLIKHWYGTTLQQRVVDEVMAGGFGKGWFLKSNRSKQLVLCPPHQGVPSTSSHTQSDHTMTMATDDHISQSIEDEWSRKTWVLLRQVEHVIRSHDEHQVLGVEDLRDSCLTTLANNKLMFHTRRGLHRVMQNLFGLCSYINPAMPPSNDYLVEDCMGIADPFVDGSSSGKSPWNSWLEVADYCLGRSGFMDASETLFTAGGKTCLQKGQFISTDCGALLEPSVVNAFARVLNYEWSKVGITSRVSFPVIAIDAESITEKDVVKEWRDWIKDSKINLLLAAFVLVPVVYGTNYYLLVFNFVDNKMQCISTRPSAEANLVCDQRYHLIGSWFCVLLRYLHDDRVADAAHFAFERVRPKWSPLVTSSESSGVCVMNMMERFSGSSLDLDLLRLNEDHKITQLRVAYACLLALSTVNQRRAEVLERTAGFIRSKADV